MDGSTVDDLFNSHTALGEVSLIKEVSVRGKDTPEMDDTMKILTKVDFDVTCSSQKLVNLHLLLMHLLTWYNDLEATAVNGSYILATSIEKALVFDLLSGILDSELRETERYLDTLKAEIVDVRHKTYSCIHLKEQIIVLEDKLCDSEELWKRSQEQVLEIKMQSAMLQRLFLYFKHEKRENDEPMESTKNGQLLSISAKWKKQTTLQRHVLSMLEKSLSRNLDLEKNLSKLGQNEEQLKLKLHYTEQVALRMEEAAEVIWGRFLEAENASEVLMGISKEQLGRLQIVQFHLHGSIQREVELKSKLEDCIEQLKAKDDVIRNLKSSNAEYVTVISDVFTLRKKVKSLEEQLKDTELQLQNANASYEASQEQLDEAEHIIESLKESLYEADNKAESAEAKVTQLTDTNLELTEELNFLKGNDSNSKKVSLLEKQVRELEIQLQHAKASSEASQEQQNMLYSAIWDMETLIEDLKSKVSKAESNTESAEEKCIVLSESNSELNKELNLLRARMESLEISLHQANNAKDQIANEVNLSTKVMTDMIMQLATERKRIQRQLHILTKDNEVLVETLQNMGKNACVTMTNGRDSDDKGLQFSQNDWNQVVCAKKSQIAESLAKSLQAEVADGEWVQSTGKS